MHIKTFFGIFHFFKNPSMLKFLLHINSVYDYNFVNSN